MIPRSLIALPLLLAACASTATEPDRAGPAASPTPDAFVVIALEHIDATETAAVLTDLLDEASGSDQRYEVVADERTNSLLVQAPPARIEQIEALVAQLDRASSGT